MAKTTQTKDNPGFDFKNRKTLKKMFSYFLVAIFLFLVMKTIATHIIAPTESKGDPQNISSEKGLESLPQEGGVTCQKCIKNPLTGKNMEQKDLPLSLFAVVIDNHKDARPQYGLNQAGLVYETEVEGGITRYLAFFTSYDDINKIGPIRSARPFFIDWSQDVPSLLVHCGGSPQALAEIAKFDINNLNEFYRSNYFWRDKTLPSPHNIFTSSASINEYLDRTRQINSGHGIEINEEKFYNKDIPGKYDTENKKEHLIGIMYKQPHYDVEWEYDQQKNGYIRYLAGEKHLTGDGEKIISQNVIIHYATASIKDEKLRLDRKTIGEGDALVCQKGECQEGYWSKEARNKATQYFTKTNTKNPEVIKLLPGVTWVEVVRPETEITY